MKTLTTSSGNNITVDKGSLSDVELVVRSVGGTTIVSMTLKEAIELKKNIDEILKKLHGHLAYETEIRRTSSVPVTTEKKSDDEECDSGNSCKDCCGCH